MSSSATSSARCTKRCTSTSSPERAPKAHCQCHVRRAAAAHRDACGPCGAQVRARSPPPRAAPRGGPKPRVLRVLAAPGVSWRAVARIARRRSATSIPQRAHGPPSGCESAERCDVSSLSGWQATQPHCGAPPRARMLCRCAAPPLGGVGVMGPCWRCVSESISPTAARRPVAGKQRGRGISMRRGCTCTRGPTQARPRIFPRPAERRHASRWCHGVLGAVGGELWWPGALEGRRPSLGRGCITWSGDVSRCLWATTDAHACRAGDGAPERHAALSVAISRPCRAGVAARGSGLGLQGLAWRGVAARTRRAGSG